MPGHASFWRAFEFRAEPPRLIAERPMAPGFGLRLDGWPGVAYAVETTTDFFLPSLWQDWTNFTLTNASRSLLWPSAEEPERFFRGKAQ